MARMRPEAGGRAGAVGAQQHLTRRGGECAFAKAGIAAQRVAGRAQRTAIGCKRSAAKSRCRSRQWVEIVFRPGQGVHSGTTAPRSTR